MEENINKEEKKCEICKESAAYICFDCPFYLCYSCFEFIHGKNANMMHQKDEIDPFILLDIKCPEHQQNSMNLFCINERSNKYIILIFII